MGPVAPVNLWPVPPSRGRAERPEEAPAGLSYKGLFSKGVRNVRDSLQELRVEGIIALFFFSNWGEMSNVTSTWGP